MDSDDEPSISRGPEILSANARDLMIWLDIEDKRLLLDHCLGLTFASQTAHVEALLAHNEQASDIHRRIQVALGPLNSLCRKECPNELADRTIRLLCTIAGGSMGSRKKESRSCVHE